MAQNPSDSEPMLRKSATFTRSSLPRDYTPSFQFLVNLPKNIWGQAPAAVNNRISESLDYEPIQNKVYYDKLTNKKESKKKIYGYTGHTLAKFLVTFATGVIVGCFAVAMTKSVGWLTEMKLHVVEQVLEGEGAHKVIGAFLWFWIYGTVLVSIAVAMVQYWAPASAGAGVTLVMAYLNGNHIPNLLRFSTLVTKFVGTVCAVSSGLPMGPEGPMVHIGAATASVITYLECKCLTSGWWGACFGKRLKQQGASLKEKLKVLDEIVSDADHREFVSAGVAAGISAAFGAPVGGVLFAMEEACSFWSKKIAWRCFLAAILSTFTIQLLNQSAQHGMIAFTNLNRMDNKDWMMQLPFLLFNSAIAGLLGAAFNSFRMWLWKVRAAKTRHVLRIAEVIGLVFLVALCGFFFGWTAGSCLPKPETWEEDYGVRFRCEEGEYNDVATLFLSSQHHTIIKLFSVGHDDLVQNDERGWSPPFTRGALALFATVYLLLMSIGAGLAIPGGLFMPSIVLGASWGCLWGTVLRFWLPRWNIMPGLYAILAGTGVLGGVFRSAISLVVLVVEGTRGIDYLFGVILAVVVANWVAHFVHHDGVYESELERVGNVYMLRDEPPHRLHTLTADAIMATGVVGFKVIDSVPRILEVLKNTTHNGFPVYHQDYDLETGEADAEGGQLEGTILRSQLLVLLQRRYFCDSHGHPIGREPDDGKALLDLECEMRTFFRRYYTHARYLSATQHALDGLQLAPSEATDMYLDLRPFINRSPFTIRKDCSASRAHQAFLQLGLRHLFVVDGNDNKVVGVITRKDLDHAAGHGWWRMSHVAEPPKSNMLRQIQSQANLLFGKMKSKRPSQGDLLVNVGHQDGANGDANGHGHGHGATNGVGQHH